MSDAQDRNKAQVQHNPVCPVCAHPMVILRIEPGQPDPQMRMYKCPECQLVEVKIVKRRRRSVAVLP